MLMERNLNGSHALEHTYTVWYCDQQTKGTSLEDYESNLRMITSFSTLEDFWSIYCHMKPIADIHTECDIFVFRDNVRPVWEDEENINGGRWCLSLSKEATGWYWEHLLFGMIGEQFILKDEVCGAALSIKPEMNIISLWCKQADENFFKSGGVKANIIKVLNLSNVPHALQQLRFKYNSKRIKDTQQQQQSQ